ncbi:hypothetical protein C1645_834037 [Glomus cerebriforme]|uniref:BACK domain-containing protein n=1 Tax=Glomus cerebriforme TaxID=658196 RepID=A0A397SEI5_9GLOM|nr:hypothetical protein C1645_834037 [Glomus cerebriforme]
MSTKFYEEMINHKKLYETKGDYDMKIYADGIEEKNDYFILNSSYSPQIFEILIKRIRTSILVNYIQEILIENHYNFIKKSFLEILELTYQKKFLNRLWDYCIHGICWNSDHLFKSTKFLTLNPAILEIILKRDDFHIDNEITIWEKLLKWTCRQHPVIQQDINKWNKNDFIVMERRLSRFIPLIRFYHISSKDFLLKIYPFKKLLPNDLVNSIFVYHMVPNNKLNINMQPPRYPEFSHSTIIECQHLKIFSSWIDKKENFRDRNTFHEKCDNKGATIIIAKITDSEHIIGGYSPLEWDSSSGTWRIYDNHNYYTKIDVPTSRINKIVNVDDYELDDVAFYKLSNE